jgi:mevalonate kinase
MKVRAPGKLILSGEHAVVYGHPALAMAVDRYVTLEITQHMTSGISFNLIDLNRQCDFTFSGLDELSVRVKERYKLFQKGIVGVRDILSNPLELVQFALALLFQEYPFSNGIKIQVQSSIPMGCGMGSSAATILSVLFGVAEYLQLHIPEEKYYPLALEAENMQHGHSSGIDLQTSLYGGCIYRQDGQVVKRKAPSLSMFLVNTGTPTVSTGECVTHAAPYFKTSKIGDDFAAVTQSLDQALLANALLESKQVIRANHQLLKTIGVVPEKVCRFIHDIEASAGAAKICGAGAIAGDSAGMVLVMIEDETLLKNINLPFGYSILPIQCAARGVHVV